MTDNYDPEICTECGSLIVDVDKHDQFHADLTKYAYIAAVLKKAHEGGNVHALLGLGDRISDQGLIKWADKDLVEIIDTQQPKSEEVRSRVNAPLTKPPRAFILQRDEDVSGSSGTGVVAWGVEFPDGVCALRWTAQWPTSVVFHDRGIESVQYVHGHAGRTHVVYIDELDRDFEENI